VISSAITVRAARTPREAAAPVEARIWPAWIVVGALHLVPLIAVAGGWFTIHIEELAPFYAVFLILLGYGVRLRRLKRHRVATACETSGLFYLAAAGTALSCAVMTAFALPYADARLAAADRALGFDWLAMLDLFRDAPQTARMMGRAYEALNWAPQLLIVLLSALGLPMLAWRFLTGWLICLLLTALVYPFFPAIAAFHHYGLSPEMIGAPTARISWDLPQVMEDLRTGITRTLGADQLTGLVTMPSFHAAGAILLVHGYGALRWLRWPAALVGGAMFLSAVPIGGHYLVDIIAGLGLALLSIRVAEALIGRPSPRHEAGEEAAPGPVGRIAPA